VNTCSLENEPIPELTQMYPTIEVTHMFIQKLLLAESTGVYITVGTALATEQSH